MTPLSGAALREGAAADIPVLRAIEADGLGAYAALPGFETLVHGAVRDPEELERGMREGGVLVADVDGVAAAFAMVWSVDGRAHLAELAVRSAYQRRGLGAALAAAVLRRAEASGRSCVTLTCFREVPWNAAWYARLGWREIGVDPADRPQLAAVMAEEAAAGYAIQPRLAMEYSFARP